MRGLLFKGNEDVSMVLLNDLKPDRGEVLIKVKATGICGSDVHGYLGITGRRIPPMIMGHEFSGYISEIGEGVKNFTAGDRVTVQPLIFCGECEYCGHGLTNLCENKKFYGAMDVNGSMAEYICVPEKLVYKLPDSISYLHGTMIEPLAVAYSAVKRAPEIEGKNVLVVGAGTIGLLVLQIVRSKKPGRIFVVDINELRLDLAKKMGADFVLNPKNTDIKEFINSETMNRGVDIAFEVVGISATVQQAMSVLKKNGICVWVGNSEKMINVNMQEVVTKELNITGTYAYTHQEFGETINLLAGHNLDLDSMISNVVHLDEGPLMFKRLVKESSELIKVILTD
ncbi:MAG: alcohol dehydrogenase catalytic domain-containing protein [Clostridiales bacterium]|nr:alcohol dehydrogenase catalytic domain-containing protein [Clostridiales bacterium]